MPVFTRAKVRRQELPEPEVAPVLTAGYADLSPVGTRYGHDTTRDNVPDQGVQLLTERTWVADLLARVVQMLNAAVQMQRDRDSSGRETLARVSRASSMSWRQHVVDGSGRASGLLLHAKAK